MSFGVSETYIYTYIAFALVYLVASIAFVSSALRVSTGLSRAARARPSNDPVGPGTVSAVMGHGQRIVDYTQLATLLPLVYIVGSMFLGSVIVRNVDLARTVNIAWVGLTVVCGLAAIVLAVLGVRESGAISQVDSLSGRVPEGLQRVGMRLGVSAALLLLVAVFTLLNLWSIITSLDLLNTVDFLL